MKINLRMAALAAVILAQLAALIVALPLDALFRADSRDLRLRTGLFDPLDIMRGRYVRLDFEHERVLAAELPSLAAMSAQSLSELEGQEFFCAFTAPGPDGFSEFEDASIDRPPDGRFYMAGFELRTVTETEAGIELRFDFPFDRYYLQENIASEAERLLAEAGEGSAAALMVRVAPNGTFTVEGLQLDGVALERRAGGNE